MIWNETMECMKREDMRKLQGIRLKQTVERVYHNTPFYRKKMQEIGITPNDINSIDDIVKLPFTTKQDLRDNYPFGLFAVPMSEIVRLHASSGTTGRPTVVGYTRQDLVTWAESVARCLSAYGTDKNDIFHVSYGYGLFTGGMGLHYGVENLGATVIPMSSGNTAKQIQLMRDFGPTALACTPSYALYLADAIQDSGIPREEFKLRVGIFGAEPWTENMRREIESKLGIKAYDIYGLSEVMGPGVAHECEYQHGAHISEDHFYPEIIDPKTLEPLAPGESGELVFTTITKEGLPLLRYRTKDLCSLIYEPCPCGRTTVRMTRITGRSDDMFIIKGVNIFPMQVEKILVQFPELGSNYLITLETVNNQDEMVVEVELSDLSTDNYIELERIRKEITRQLKDEILVTPKLKLVKKGSLPQSEGKAVRVKDLRQNH